MKEGKGVPEKISETPLPHCTASYHRTQVLSRVFWERGRKWGWGRNWCYQL